MNEGPLSVTKKGRFVKGPQTGEPEIRSLIVKGILYSEDNPAAVIGTQIVHEGDNISDTTVVRINRDGVVLEMNGKRWTQEVQQ
jgi:type II secretory pathway component PulC